MGRSVFIHACAGALGHLIGVLMLRGCFLRSTRFDACATFDLELIGTGIVVRRVFKRFQHL